jgi:uncharacterized protein (TIGR03118 family)
LSGSGISRVAPDIREIRFRLAAELQLASKRGGKRMDTATPRRIAAGVVIAAAAMLAAAIPGSAAVDNAYSVHPLVSDVSGAAPTTDSNLVNAWGLTASSTSPWWVADNGTDRSTLYNGNSGAIVPLVVQVGGGPTGAVFNGTASFVVQSGAVSGPARFIFASEDGTIRGWNPAVSPTVAQVAVDRSSAGAIYKGLAIAQTASGPQLYAADFHNAQVDVFGGSWNLVGGAGSFVDPSLPAGYAPFGIQTIGSRVFVSYAKQDEEAEDEIAGQGLGFVDVYDTAGDLLGRVAQHGQLNAPWGLAVAPASFGRFGGDLLVGNFGDGEINAYEELGNGQFEHRGELRGADGKTLAIDGLWALEFGNGGQAGPTGTLFFTAGPDEETHGLFGSITAG